MGGGELSQTWFSEVDVETLRLADVWSSCSCKLNELLLTDLPDGLVDVLELLSKTLDLLNGSLIGNKLVSGFSIPDSELDEVLDQVRVDTDELATEDSSGVNVGGVWLKALIVAHDLSGGCCWHWGNEEGVSGSVLHDFRP